MSRLLLPACCLLLLLCGCRRYIDEKRWKNTAELKRRAAVLHAHEISYTNEELDHFFTMAARARYGHKLTKWESDGRIQVLGRPEPDDLQALGETLKLFNGLSMHVRFSLAQTASNIQLHFTDPREFEDYVPFSTAERRMGVVGVCGSRKSSVSFFRKSVIVIDTTLGQAERSHVLRHELMHMLGFGHARRRDSLMWPSTEGAPNFSVEDRSAIAMLYRDDIFDGMHRTAALKVFRPH